MLSAVFITMLCLVSGVRESPWIFFYAIFYLVVTLVDLHREKNGILGNNIWTLPTFCRARKMGKSVKYLKFRVALESLRTVWQVFDTFFNLPGKAILRSSNFGDDEWHVRR